MQTLRLRIMLYSLGYACYILKRLVFDYITTIVSYILPTYSIMVNIIMKINDNNQIILRYDLNALYHMSISSSIVLD